MNRDINVSLNKFPSVPISLRADPGKDIANDHCEVDLAGLYHHYYLDSYGRRPPSPDPTNFEYIQFLSDTKDFRIRGSGIGDSTTKKRHASNELGQAFCRWFLHDHLNITYFAHMDSILNKGPLKRMYGIQIERAGKGDVPDYLCAKHEYSVYLAEAKGRYSSISFQNREFAKWRKQFSRVEIKDSHGNLRSLKGFIVGTRFSTERNLSSLKSCVFAEDPRSPGERSADEPIVSPIFKLVQRLHYANIFEKLNQPLVAAALATGSRLPEQLLIQAVSWRLPFDHLKHMEFVGGYYQTSLGSLPFQMSGKGLEANAPDSLRLDQGRGVFVGLERNIFESLCRSVRTQNIEEQQAVEPIDNGPPFYSAISLLRDGSIIGPAEFYQPIESVQA